MESSNSDTVRRSKRPKMPKRRSDYDDFIISRGTKVEEPVKKKLKIEEEIHVNGKNDEQKTTEKKEENIQENIQENIPENEKYEFGEEIAEKDEVEEKLEVENKEGKTWIWEIIAKFFNKN